ncbi:hypothetical protein JTB14_019766 [Gonioctena quinquepunctata]|nr:hypothetical protein JTB14_019766 [Gonioctena quinquepunctata]
MRCTNPHLVRWFKGMPIKSGPGEAINGSIVRNWPGVSTNKSFIHYRDVQAEIFLEKPCSTTSPLTSGIMMNIIESPKTSLLMSDVDHQELVSRISPKHKNCLSIGVGLQHCALRGKTFIISMDRRIPLTDKEFDSLVDQDEDIQEALSEESSNEVEEGVEPEDQNQLSMNNLSGKKKKLQKRKVVWKHRGIHLNDLQLAFHGDTDLPPAVMALETPYSFFSYFFSDDFVESIVEQTNLFATQTNPNIFFFTVTDIKQFMGICFYTSIVDLPSVGSYWSSDIGYDRVKNVTPLNEFKKIRQFIHFNDNFKQVPRDSPGKKKTKQDQELKEIIDIAKTIASKIETPINDKNHMFAKYVEETLNALEEEDAKELRKQIEKTIVSINFLLVEFF